jgi:hypothetical protein
MIQDNALVLGTRQAPVRYLIAVQHGKLALDGGYQFPRTMLRTADMHALGELGYLKPPEVSHG